MILVEALVRADRHDEALQLLSRIEPNTLAERRGWARQAEILFELGRDREAEEVLSRLAAEGTLDDLTLLAEVYQSRERYEESIPVLERALELDPDSTSLLFWLAAANERSGKKRQAEDVLQQLLTIDPELCSGLELPWLHVGGSRREPRKGIAAGPAGGGHRTGQRGLHRFSGMGALSTGPVRRGSRFPRESRFVGRGRRQWCTSISETSTLSLAGSSRRGTVYERALDLEADNAAVVRGKLDRLAKP